MPRRTSFAILMLLGFLFCLGISARAQATSTAVFVSTDTTTQGNWKNVYGSDGYNIINDTGTYPSYAQVTPSGHSSWTWASTTSDVRALQKASTTNDRIAATWFATTSFTIDLNITDGKTHRVALYCLDWSNAGRAQTIDILEASTNSLLNSQNVSSFGNGKYLVWNISGNLRIRITATGTGNAVVSGLFFSNNPMTVGITAPLNQAIFTAPASITIDANASHSDGTISKVEFFQASTKLGEDTTTPYSFLWSGVGAGNYTLTAKATDNTGATATSTQVNISVTAAGGISYFYDELGRLVGVTDPASDTATYSYDAVGNLLSISRRSSSLTSIIEFTPDIGTTGTSVTIYGTGFSTTANQNTVTFNGVAATVTSATATQIITSVPTGATSGPIVVTSPAGSATSSTSFTVSGSTGAPTITGFTPTIGTPGTAVTINGSNFETTAVNNRVTFNITNTSVISSNATSIATTVPAVGSGRISVGTPRGKAVSSSDFFVPPVPYLASEVEFTGRMAIGGSSSVTINTVDKIGLMVFDATAGQRVSLNLTNVTMSGFNVAIYNPDRSTLFASTSVGTPGAFIDTNLLPATGTYTILIDPTTTNTGSVTLTLSDVSDVIGTITPGGSALTLTTTFAGQNARAFFNGTAGQRVSLIVSTTIFNSIVTIIKPDGAMLDSKGVLSENGAFFEPMSLPVTGKYTILVDSLSTYTGSVTLTLYNMPADVTGTITPGGAAVTVNITTPGQNGQLTFSGTANQKISLNLTGVTIAYVTVTIRKPDGTTLASAPSGTGGAFIDTLTLPVTGTYTIFIDPAGSNTGNITLNLYDVVNFTGTVTIGGGAQTVTISVPGQNGQLTFSGTSGQQVTVRVTGNNLGMVTVTLLKPDGSTLTSYGSSASSFDLATQTLPTTGTYTISVDPNGAATGSLSVSVTSP